MSPTMEKEQLEEIKRIRMELESLTEAVYELREAIVEGIKYLKNDQ